MDSYLDILPVGSTALAVKEGGGLFIDYEGISSTGCWPIAKNKVYDYVIVFSETIENNLVYIGEFTEKKEESFIVRSGKEYPRYRVYMKNFRLALETNASWTVFLKAKNKGFSIKYLEHKNLEEIKYLDPDSFEAIEGYKKDSNYMTSIRDKKLADLRKKKDNYTCQSCNKKYIVNNNYIIDCHHLTPMSLGSRKTELEDLISLCPTCHRIAHTRIPPYNLSELKNIIENLA